MPHLLLELFSEEIPARMQSKAADDLRAAITNGLVEAGLTYEGAQVHATPRRLVLAIDGLNAKAQDTREERKGPKVDAPQAAIDGFLRSTGLTHDQLTVQDDKKGKFYLAIIKKDGRAATDVIAELVPHTIRTFPWPKSMRWGCGTLKWVRPLHSILCTFDGEVVPFDVEGIHSGNTTHGHRFMAPAAIKARRYDDYETSLHKAHVIVDATARAETIRTESRNLAFAQGLEMIEDEALLKEVAGLVEWPVVLMGEFDANYLSVPPEVIITTIKNNQKCFCLKKPDGRLANRYLLVANTIARDGGTEIIRGNNKVIAARLSDAKFFWDQDRRETLHRKVRKLHEITFQSELGNQGQRALRLESFSERIAKLIGADSEVAKQSGFCAKADLVTGLVGEFPELQGLVGGYIAREYENSAAFEIPVRDHYKPQGPADGLPATKEAQAVALADKLDTLVGFWATGQKPTSSKDPYALRRACLGVIRILIEGNNRIAITSIIREHVLKFESLFPRLSNSDVAMKVDEYFRVMKEAGLPVTFEEMSKLVDALSEREFEKLQKQLRDWLDNGVPDLLSFFADRLKVYLKDKGARHDLIDAVFALGGQDDLLMIVKRVEALTALLSTDDGKNLLAGVKRAANILKIEEKKDGVTYAGTVNPDLLIKGEEKTLHQAINAAAALARKAVEAEDFEAAMKAIAKLRVPVDTFFEQVTVNDKDPNFRTNRLRLLNRIREATAEVADFSKIEG